MEPASRRKTYAYDFMPGFDACAINSHRLARDRRFPLGTDRFDIHNAAGFEKKSGREDRKLLGNGPRTGPFLSLPQRWKLPQVKVRLQ